MRTGVKTLFPLLLALALLAGCKEVAGNDTRSSAGGAEKASPTPIEAESRKTGYLHTDDDSATFIQWAKAERRIEGQMQVLDVNREGKTDSSSYSFEGVFDGDNLSLTFRGRHQTSLEGITVTGTLKGDALTLVWPQSNGTLLTQKFRPASVAEYNDAAHILQERAKEIVADSEQAAKLAEATRVEAAKLAAEKRAVVEAQNMVTGAAESLRKAVRELPGADFYADALRSYGETWRRLKDARAELLAESKKPLTSHQLGKVERKLGIVSQRLGDIESRRGSFESSLSSANTRIRDTEEEVARFQTAFAQLQKAVAANTTGAPRAAVMAVHKAKAVESARSEINKAVAARDAAKSRAAAYDKQAADLYRQAEAFAKTLKPTGRDKRRN
jgi:tetratricopeptide (TPR) repeat protein